MEKKPYQRWCDEQDDLLVKQVLRHGRQWVFIQAQYLQMFSLKQIQNRLNYLCNHCLSIELADKIKKLPIRVNKR